MEVCANKIKRAVVTKRVAGLSWSMSFWNQGHHFK